MTSLQFLFLFFCTLCFGLIIGAYYGTIEYRIRMNLPLVTSYCFCPSCNHRLTLFQQTPVLAWFVLKGKCHYCHTPIPIRYPVAESAFGAYYALTFLITFRHPWILLLLWFAFITIALVIRSKRQFRQLLKGLGIMYGYHLLYGALILLILCS